MKVFKNQELSKDELEGLLFLFLFFLFFYFFFLFFAFFAFLLFYFFCFFAFSQLFPFSFFPSLSLQVSGKKLPL